MIGEIKSFVKISSAIITRAAKALNEVMEKEDFFKNFTAELQKMKTGCQGTLAQGSHLLWTHSTRMDLRFRISRMAKQVSAAISSN